MAEERKNNAKCRMCSNDTYCEQCDRNPKDAEKYEHVCYECYQKQGGQVENLEKTHVCIPPEKISEAYDRFLSDTTNQAFVELWDAEKKKLKELSKKEIAQTSFFEGARFMLHFMRKMSEEEEAYKQKHKMK